MSEYMWGATKQKLSRRACDRRDRLARKIGGRGYGFVFTVLPGEGWNGWFFGPNRGEPFDRAIGREISAAVAQAEKCTTDEVWCGRKSV